jgi:hypothetical protein
MTHPFVDVVLVLHEFLDPPVGKQATEKFRYVAVCIANTSHAPAATLGLTISVTRVE